MAIYDYMEWVSAEEIDYENIVEYATKCSRRNWYKIWAITP